LSIVAALRSMSAREQNSARSCRSSAPSILNAPGRGDVVDDEQGFLGLLVGRDDEALDALA
jgi:hypothetical protein